jgi:hypothetical protein
VPFEESSSIRRSSSRSSSACSLRTRSVARSSSSEDWACSVNSIRTRYSAALAASSASRSASSRIGLPRNSAAVSAPSAPMRLACGEFAAACRACLKAWRLSIDTSQLRLTPSPSGLAKRFPCSMCQRIVREDTPSVLAACWVPTQPEGASTSRLLSASLPRAACSPTRTYYTTSRLHSGTSRRSRGAGS